MDLENCSNFEGQFQGFQQLLLVIPGEPKSAKSSPNSSRIANSIKRYIMFFWPSLEEVYAQSVSVSSNAIIFQNVVILVVNVTKCDQGVSQLISKFKESLENEQAEKLEGDEIVQLQEFLDHEDEVNKIKVSSGLKLLKVRTKTDKSVTVSKMKISKKECHGEMESDVFGALEIETNCFKIRFECNRVEHVFTSGKKNSDIDNIHSCYQDAFYKCVKHVIPGAITDARVREMWALDWCSFRDAEET